MCSDVAFVSLTHFLIPPQSKSESVMSVYQQILYMYDIKLADEREVAKTIVEFLVDELDPDLPLKEALAMRDEGQTQNDEEDGNEVEGEDDDSGDASPLRVDPSKPGCVIFVFNRD